MYQAFPGSDYYDHSASDTACWRPIRRSPEGVPYRLLLFPWQSLTQELRLRLYTHYLALRHDRPEHSVVLHRVLLAIYADGGRIKDPP
jgi:hypothetical protein